MNYPSPLAPIILRYARLPILFLLGLVLAFSAPPARAQDCNCSPMVLAGSDTPVTNTYNIGVPNGQFIFYYQTYTQPDEIIVTAGGVTLFDTGCVGATGTVTLSYSGPGIITAQVIPNCAGGSGTAWQYSLNWCSFYSGPTCTPTATPPITPIVTPPPTLTPTATPCGEFSVSENILRPSQGQAQIQVEECGFAGDYSLVVYNTAGEHIRTLDDRQVGDPFIGTYTWDGTNKYGQPCSNGVYILRLALPSGIQTRRLILLR